MKSVSALVLPCVMLPNRYKICRPVHCGRAYFQRKLLLATKTKQFAKELQERAAGNVIKVAKIHMSDLLCRFVPRGQIVLYHTDAHLTIGNDLQKWKQCII